VPIRPDPAFLARTSLSEFRDSRTDDLFEKCGRFFEYAEATREVGAYQAMYRVPLASGLDHRIVIDDPYTGRRREMVCFDSNSYLGLHLHPRVVAAAHRVLDEVGLGTPSAQVLGGTNRHLVALEEEVATMLGRPAAVIFPSGYQANVGILTALLREKDAVLLDRFSHASLHDGARYSGARRAVWEHRDPQDLDRCLAGCDARGKLVVTDGVFSMHGGLAPLPALRAVCDRHGARLMVDDAHGLGILGASGRGIEEHFDMPGEVDVLMGTFSKAPGAAGGYVAGDPALVEYLRFFAHGSLFTATLPAPVCAGLTEAVRVMREEPWHREALWANVGRMHGALVAAGLQVPALESPILAVRVGDEALLPVLAVQLFHADIKCGIARYPAVPHGESILRFTVNARHTAEDIDHTVAVLAELASACGLVAGRAA